MNIHPTQVKKVLKTESLSNELFKPNNFFSFKTLKSKCASELKEAQILDNDVRLCYEIICTPETDASIEVRFEFLTEMHALYTLIGKFKTKDSEQIFKADPKNVTYSITMPNAPSENFFLMGLEHIGASLNSWKNKSGRFQIADGIDHILFLVVLLLVSINLRSLLINVTGFTLGHSLALALSFGRILSIPSGYIEPAIALSIAYLAFKGTLNKKEDSLKLTMAFGFLHGMGFSYLLQNLHSSSFPEFIKTLFMFNIGIEAGQLVILLLLTPLFIYINRSSRHATSLKFLLCAIILMLALYWSFERVAATFT